MIGYDELKSEKEQYRGYKRGLLPREDTAEHTIITQLTTPLEHR